MSTVAHKSKDSFWAVGHAEIALWWRDTTRGQSWVTRSTRSKDDGRIPHQGSAKANHSRAPVSVSHINKLHERLRAGSSWNFCPARHPTRKIQRTPPETGSRKEQSHGKIQLARERYSSCGRQEKIANTRHEGDMCGDEDSIGEHKPMSRLFQSSAKPPPWIKFAEPHK